MHVLTGARADAPARSQLTARIRVCVGAQGLASATSVTCAVLQPQADDGRLLIGARSRRAVAR